MNPPDHLDRIDQRSLPLSGTYSYSAAGVGVRAYVIDSGVRAQHPEFTGRVAAGHNVLDGGTDTSDCLGHGTHVAGTLASSTYGVAKGATIVPVKTFGCADSTTLSALIAGVDWAVADHRPGEPAVANLSLSGGASRALDQAVTALSNDGVAVAVAAGERGRRRLPRLAGPGAPGADRRGQRRRRRHGQLLERRAVRRPLRPRRRRHLHGRPLQRLGRHVRDVDVVAERGGAPALEMSVQGTTAQEAQNRVLARTSITVTGTGRRCGLLSGCRPATPGNRLLFVG